jgi:predicted  nucleic acid-binding Zn-ribbon protein
MVNRETLLGIMKILIKYYDNIYTLGAEMGGTSEREYMEKLSKMRDNMNKKASDVRKEFTKLEKAKVNLLKKTEDTRHNIEHEIGKLQQKMAKSRDLVSESKRRLSTETVNLKREIEETYFDLRTRIAEAMVPA